MSDSEDPLAVVGFSKLDPDVSPELYAELYRVARRIREAGRTVVGLLPVGPDVGITHTAIKLGYVLADACEGVIAIVDANPRWPALREIKVGKSDRSQKSGFKTTWVESFLAIVSPTEISDTLRLEGLDFLLTRETLGFAHMLVDLTGFEKVGAHLGLFELIDGVLMVGHPGAINERRILSLRNEVPPDKMLGVVLVG